MQHNDHGAWTDKHGVCRDLITVGCASGLWRPSGTFGLLVRAAARALLKLWETVAWAN